MIRRALIAVIILVAVPVLFFAFRSLTSRRPTNLGLTDTNELRLCPNKPNCVCSLDQRPRHQVEPFPLTGPPQEDWKRLGEVIASQPRAQIITQDERYLHAEFTTPVFRFVDDVEFLLDEAGGQIHVRSASRVGYSDFGVNRSRIKQIRQAFLETAPQD